MLISGKGDGVRVISKYENSKWKPEAYLIKSQRKSVINHREQQNRIQSQTSQLGLEFIRPLSLYKDLGSYFEWKNLEVHASVCAYVCAY